MSIGLEKPGKATEVSATCQAFYEIDQDDRIVALNADWDIQAAQGDGGPRCTAAAIIGRPLMDFMAGDATRMFMRSALQAVRLLGQARTLPYRCDSPSERRRFEMVLGLLPCGGVRIEHVLVEQTPRFPGMQRLVRSGHIAPGWCCSQCLSVKLLGASEWQPPETRDAVLLAMDICPVCQNRLESQEPRSAAQA
jgi:hypothetical protein